VRDLRILKGLFEKGGGSISILKLVLGPSEILQTPFFPNFVIFLNFHFPKPPKTSMKRPKKMMGNCNISNIPKTSMKRPRKVIVKMVIFGMFCHLLVALFFLKNDHF